MTKVFPKTFSRPFGRFGQVVVFWIIVSGFWRDEGRWIDSAYWKDGV